MGNRRTLAADVARRLRLLRDIWGERRTLRWLFESGNYAFIRFALPGHFYSPIPNINDVRSESSRDFGQTDIPGIDLHLSDQLALLREFANFYPDFPLPEKKSKDWLYYLDNGFFSYGDGVTLYSMMRHFKPSRIIEVGCGFSSAAMIDVNDKFFNGNIDLTFIEPYPDRLIELLGDRLVKRSKIIQKRVQEVPETLFSSLRENDILFIDSSHVAKMKSDVVHLIFYILASLKRGVLVHFHDILWPFEYPKLWLEEGRAWNEAYILRAFMQYNSAFSIVYFNSLMEHKHGDFLRKEMPLSMKTPSSAITPSNASLWIRKMAADGPAVLSKPSDSG
jgi:hypothetical protein